MSYPILYAQDATDFFSLGLGPMHNVFETHVHEVANSAFYLELKMLTDKTVKENQIIKVHAGHLLKDQRFVIKKITDNHDGTSEIYAEHVSYLTQELTLKPETRISNLNGQSVVVAWKSAILEDNPFSVYSDITTTASTTWRIDKVNNPRRALGGVEGSILDIWGGEYRFDNYQISLLKKRGTTAQTVLAYGRNITGFEMVTDIESVYTSIYPFAIYENEGVEELIAIDGLVVDVENIENYPNRRTLPVNFSDKFEHDEKPTKERLIALAEQYITANNVGVPKVSIRVNFLDLSQTADYAEYKGLETVNLCDDVRVIYPSLGVDTVAKVTRVKWNVLTDSYDEIEIGEKRLTLGSQLNDKIESLEKDVNNQINSSQISADGKNTIFYGLFGEDGLGEPVANKVGDMWFKPNGEFEGFYIWNGTIWKFIMTTGKFTEITDKIENLEQELEDAKDQAQAGLNKAEQAIEAAGDIGTNLENYKLIVQDTYANKSSVTHLSTLWQQTTDLANGHTSQISSLGDQINLRVTKDEFKKVSGRNLAIDCPKTLKLTGDGSWQHTQANYFRLPKSLQGEKVTVSLTITRHGSASFGNVGVYLDGSYQNIFATILNNIGVDETKRFTRTLTISTAHELSGYVQIGGGNLNGSIALSDFKIEYGEAATDYSQAPENDVNNKTLITQINLSEDGILIQGKKIIIDGETYITNGVIKDAMIDSVTATKVITGTLDAANVNIINLNASKLVADRIDGLSLYGSYIEGGEIRGNALIYLNNGINNTVLSADYGISTTRTIAAKQQIRSEDWIYAGRAIDGVTTELGGFHGWRVMTNFVDPLQTNGTLAIGQRSTINAKAVHYLDSTFKRYANVDMALRIGTVAEQPPTTGMYTLWCGSAYAGTGLYVTAPNGQTRSVAIF